jgi:hypothetical protein
MAKMKCKMQIENYEIKILGTLREICSEHFAVYNFQ